MLVLASLLNGGVIEVVLGLVAMIVHGPRVFQAPSSPTCGLVFLSAAEATPLPFLCGEKLDADEFQPMVDRPDPPI
jgi:hypothetical protein